MQYQGVAFGLINHAAQHGIVITRPRRETLRSHRSASPQCCTAVRHRGAAMLCRCAVLPRCATLNRRAMPWCNAAVQHRIVIAESRAITAV
jgi:hypothetical protein